MPSRQLIDGRHPFTVGIKAGGWDDADHIVKDDKDQFTLCGMYASERNVVKLGDDIDSDAACWSCVHEAQTAAESEKQAPS